MDFWLYTPIEAYKAETIKTEITAAGCKERYTFNANP